MIVLYCTKKAQRCLKIEPSEVSLDETSILGNWYCNEFTVSRQKYMIFVNERTFLSIIISAQAPTTKEDILETFKQRLFKFFLFLGLPDDKFMPELFKLNNMGFAKVNNRSIVGSMTNIVEDAKFSSYTRDVDADSFEMFNVLSRNPFKVKNFKTPRKLIAELFAEGER